MGTASSRTAEEAGHKRLVIRYEGKMVQRMPLHRGVLSIGSDPENQIILPGDEVSYRHAVLTILPDGIWIEDLNSEDGTKLNGRKVKNRQQVKPGGAIEIGMFTLLVDSGPVEEPADEPAEEPEPAPEKVKAAPPKPKPRPVQPSLPPEVLDQKQELKRQINTELLKRLEIKRLTAARIDELDLRDRVRTTIDQIIGEVYERLPMDIESGELAKEIYDEAVGLGPLEDLLADETVTEIMVNGPQQVYIEREGKLYRSEKTFLDEDSVSAIIERIVAPIGRRIDESQPYVDARLPDGSRVNAIISPLSLSGPCLTIRKFSKDPFTIDDLVRFDSLNEEIAGFLRSCVVLRKNVVVSGGTGSGKTSLLNVLSSFLPADERIVTIEDAAELRLTQDHVIRLEARPPNIEGRGAITIRDLVRNALRMRPDRIVVGECRGGEALDMLQAMNTGHEGSLTTVHANSPRDVISRLETMVLMSGVDFPIRAIREQIGAAIHLIVHIARFSDGTRKVSRVTEIVGLEGDQITMQDLFTFKQTGTSKEGRIEGRFRPTGSVPTFAEDFKTRGLHVDPALFDPGPEGGNG